MKAYRTSFLSDSLKSISFNCGEGNKGLPLVLVQRVQDLYPGGQKKKNGTVDFLGLCSDQQLSFYTLLDRASFSHYNNTKIIKFG